MRNTVIKLGVSEEKINIFYPMCDAQENGHIVILGKTGAGKSCAKDEIICQLLNNKIRVIEIDFSNSSRNYYPMNMGRKINLKTSDKISLFERFRIQDKRLEDEADYCCRIVDILCKKCKFRERQKAVLLRVLPESLHKYSSEQVTLGMVMQTLSQLDIDEAVQASIHNKLYILKNIKAFNVDKSCWNEIFSKNRYCMTVLDLSEFMESERNLVAELVLENLKGFLKYNIKESLNFQLVIDECKELDYEKDTPMDFFLTQARKYGCGLLLATQTLSDFKKNERSKLLQSSLMLNFMPAYNEVELITKLIPKSKCETEIAEELEKLNKGECIATGRFLNRVGQVTDRYSLKVYFQIKTVLEFEERSKRRPDMSNY